MRVIAIALLFELLFCLAACAEQARQYGGRYTRERLANIRLNCERYDWAAAQRQKAVDGAAPWLAMSDEELWMLVPGQDLPRCIDVTWDYNRTPQQTGCLVCGRDIFKFGNYPYNPDFAAKPWKLTCPNCGAVFPTNDFGKFYASAIDEHGLFDPAKGDRSLLYNTDHPDPADPMHNYGVDDGLGYVDSEGRAHKFIGYYTWTMWGHILGGVDRLAMAYAYTGDKACARKAAILLDRIADVYPSMDWNKYAEMGWFHSDGSSRRGKIHGRIWETGTLKTLANSYDAILSGTVDCPDLYAFLKRQSERYKLPRPKGTREFFVANVDDNILRCGAQAVISQQIMGNQGMHQSAIAACAIALDTERDTSAWLDWVFAEDGGVIPGVIVAGLDRDGFGGEGAPGYSLLWCGQLRDLAERLHEYGKYTRHDIYRDFPQFAKTITAPWDIGVLGIVTPCIGDSGGTGRMVLENCDPSAIARGYGRVPRPSVALAAYEANGGSATGLIGSVLDSDPETLAKEIETVAASQGREDRSVRVLPGFGLASLEFGRGKDGQALWCYFGRMDKHGHADRLNIGLYAFGVDLMPDLGYPEFAARWPHRDLWNNSTLSHNTVVLDGERQKATLAGHPVLFSSLPGLRAFEIESREVYPQTSDYRRTVVYAQTPDGGAYALDVFRVAGGQTHRLSFHGPPGPVAADGLSLVPREGTLAGPAVPYGSSAEGIPPGESFLYNVQSDAGPPEAFALDWKADAGYRTVRPEDDIHLRLHVLSTVDTVSLADGDPPQNKSGNPRRIRYALLDRKPSDGGSVYVSLIEPYRDRPILRSVSRVRTEEGQVVVRVELHDGAVDCLLIGPDEDSVVSAGSVSLKGKIGFLRMKGGAVRSAALICGSEVRSAGFSLKGAPSFTGTVARMDRDTEGEGFVWVRGDIPDGAKLAGRHIIIRNDRVLNACYRIQSAERQGGLWKLSCGDVSFVRGYADAADYGKGFTYNFQEGAAFSIPLDAFHDAE